MNYEDLLHAACVRYMRYQYPKFARLLHHSVNEGKRSLSQQRRIKVMGLVAGWPDLHLAIARGPYHGLFVELKTFDNPLSKVQRDVCNELREQGHRVEVIRTIDQFINLLDEYLHPK